MASSSSSSPSSLPHYLSLTPLKASLSSIGLSLPLSLLLPLSVRLSVCLCRRHLNRPSLLSCSPPSHLRPTPFCMLLRLQLSQEREEGGGVRRARPAQQPITYACDQRIDMHNVVRGARVAAAAEATIQRAITINFGRDSVRRQRNRTFPSL